jgi:hypothetical protein
VQLALVELNGGFPEPHAGAGVRVVAARHDACGEVTSVRLPQSLSPQTVRHVVCHSCAEAFDNPAVEEIALPKLSLPTVSMPRLSLPNLSLPKPFGQHVSLPKLPRVSLAAPADELWRYLSIPLAAVAVIAVLLLIQGSSRQQAGSPADSPADAPAATAAPSHKAGSGTAKAGDGDAHLMRGSTFQVALPRGWQRTTAAAGATFAASAPGAEADATLWVERDPRLDFPSFEARSMEQLRQLAGSAHIVDRVAAPTADASIVHLAADAPPDTPRYEVTLRASGPYRYYLATTVQPGASAATAHGVDLIHGSFLPEGAK